MLDGEQNLIQPDLILVYTSLLVVLTAMPAVVLANSWLGILPEVNHRGVAALTDLHRPVIVVVSKESERMIVSSALRGMLWCGHPCIPLAIKMGLVASTGHVFCHACHVSRNTHVARDWILSVVASPIGIDHIHVDWIPAGLNGRTGGRAELVDVVPIQLDALLDQLVHVRGLLGDIHIRFARVPACITPTKVVQEDVQYVRSGSIASTTVQGVRCHEAKADGDKGSQHHGLLQPRQYSHERRSPSTDLALP